MGRLHHALRAAAGYSPGGGGWTPADITTALWLDAADPSTITIDTGVSQWADKSGEGRHVTQATASTQPTYVGGEALSFNGSQWLDAGDNYLYSDSANTGLSVFLVLSSNAANTDIDMVFDFGFVADYGYGVGFNNSNAYVYAPKSHGGTSFKFSPGTTAGEAHVLCSRIGFGDSLSAYLDGVQLYSEAITLSELTAATINESTTREHDRGPVCIGTQAKTNTDTARRLDGDLMEVVVVRDAVAQADRQKIEGYLAHKWGLESNLPSDHPYKNEAP